MQPAFYHSYEYSRGRKLGVIKLNPAVASRMATDALRETLHPRHLPMLVKPKPWLSHKDGGYLHNRSMLSSHPECLFQYLSYICQRVPCDSKTVRSKRHI
jgi:DNA-directed RNA polymerase